MAFATGDTAAMVPIDTGPPDTDAVAAGPVADADPLATGLPVADAV